MYNRGMELIMPEKRKTPKRSINLYWTPEDQALLETVAAKLEKQGIRGLTKRDGEYNISAVIHHLLTEAAKS